ncbi:hypothetical protein DL96DRAFT_1609947 [Flagelloscypha sp. PMI_526]|nr:hypothetical protein DL96DRAFT_1609947 [Flagelloscypha sp. PMI_526]
MKNPSRKVKSHPQPFFPSSGATTMLPELGTDILLQVFSKLTVKDVLRVRQVSKFFFAITHETSLWLALCAKLRSGPRLLSGPPTTAALELLFKYRKNWRSANPVPVSPPQIFPTVSFARSYIETLKLVKRQGVTWLVVIYINDKMQDEDRERVGTISSVMAYPVARESHCDTAASQIPHCLDFEERVYVDEAGEGRYWSWNQDENSSNVLSMMCADGFIRTFGLSPSTGWTKLITTRLPSTIAAPRTTFLLPSWGNHALLYFPNHKRVALVQLCEKIKQVTFLLDKDNNFINHLIDARFNHEFLVVFHVTVPRPDADRFILHVYPLKTEERTIRPLARRQLEGTLLVLSPPSQHTKDMAFTFLLGSSQSHTTIDKMDVGFTHTVTTSFWCAYSFLFICDETREAMMTITKNDAYDRMFEVLKTNTVCRALGTAGTVLWRDRQRGLFTQHAGAKQVSTLGDQFGDYYFVDMNDQEGLVAYSGGSGDVTVSSYAYQDSL